MFYRQIRVRSPAAILSSLVLTAPLLAQPPQDPAAASVQLLQHREYASALSAADAALAHRPGDCRLLVLRGLAFNGERRPVDALAAFKHALNFCPASLPALEGAAQIEYAQHDAGAAPLLERVLALRPEDATSHAMLAALDWRAGDCDGALPHFAKSMSLIEKNEPAEREYGFCLLAVARRDEAVAVFANMLAADPSPANRLALAVAQREAGQFDNALATLQPLLAPPSPDERALRVAADAAEGKNDTPDAVAWLRQAILADPAGVENYLSFAALSFNHGSFQVGIDMIDAGLARNPASARLYLARGVLMVQLSRYDAALQDFSKAHQLDPALSLAEDAVGMMHSQQHQPAASLAVYRQQVARHPNDALLQYLYAEALSQEAAESRGPQLEAAVKAAQRAIFIEPQYQPARDLLCALYVQSQQFAKAVAEAETARSHAPEDQVALYQEIMAERHLGDKKQLDLLVARLQQLRGKDESKRAQYLLQKAASTPVASR